MRQIEIRLNDWKMADAMGDLSKWLDLNYCVPISFEIRGSASGTLLVQIEFADDHQAAQFKQDFRR